MLFKRMRKKNIISPIPLYLKGVTVSTNDDARAIFSSSPHSFAVLASEQTGGKGRNGKSFVSKKNNGVYLSLCFPAGEISIKKELITPAVAVAAVKAISRFGFDAQIKWVNDIFYGGKKISGILCEAITDPKTLSVTGFICGIGVNTGKKGLNGELKEIAGFIPVKADKLAGELIKEITNELCHGENADIAARYRALQLIFGKEITFSHNGNILSGKAVNTDENGALTVLSDGKEITVKSGEITLESKNFTK